MFGGGENLKVKREMALLEVEVWELDGNLQQILLLLRQMYSKMSRKKGRPPSKKLQMLFQNCR